MVGVAVPVGYGHPVLLRRLEQGGLSHYWHNVNWDLEEELSFEEALQAETGRLETHAKEFNDLGRLRYAYFRAGLYARQLRAFWQHFPRDHFRLLFHEDLDRLRFAATVESLQDFLGVPIVATEFMHSNPAYRPRNRGVDRIIRGRSLVKSALKTLVPMPVRRRFRASLLNWNAAEIKRPPMNPSTRQMLCERYRMEIQDFERLVNRDLSGWLV